MKCEKCGSETQMSVQAVISAPGELENKLTKHALRRKDVYLTAVLWETANFICINPECQYIYHGYSNYVAKLKQENEELKIKMIENEK